MARPHVMQRWASQRPWAWPRHRRLCNARAVTSAPPDITMSPVAISSGADHNSQARGTKISRDAIQTRGLRFIEVGLVLHRGSLTETPGGAIASDHGLS